MPTQLPMLGLTHGNRSPLTCHLKCDSACAFPVPNQSTEPTFREIATRQLSRRSMLIGGGAIAVAAALPVVTPEVALAAPGDTRLTFTPISPVRASRDAVTLPSGYRWTTILRWGDPLFDSSPAFNPEVPDAEAQELQFGYNNDYLDILLGEGGRQALLVCNHEYTNRAIMFPPSANVAEELEVLRTLMAAHGLSVVELERQGRRRPWRYVRGAARNRRITANTVFQLTGPAAGSDLLRTAADRSGTRVKGTVGNCAGGTTPWGTILSGEENFNGYFVADPAAKGNARYGLRNTPSTYGWEKVDPRFDATKPDYANEPNRFGYIVEIDPSDPTSVPRKHTALGRFKHEGANVRVDQNGRVAAYMGDDERFDYLYKFVARDTYSEGDGAAARRRNLRLLTEGDLYVAKFLGSPKPTNDNLGRGTWVPLTQNGESVVPGFSTAEVLVYTRLAADAVDATPMDRCEDVEPSLASGKVYVTCTNNTSRGNPDDARTTWVDESKTDAANPRAKNKDGHIIEITEQGNRANARSFEWNLFLVCGDPTTEAGTYFGGYPTPTTPISCPDNVAFDSAGNLWVATDGAASATDPEDYPTSTFAKADGLFKVAVEGADRGKVEQFLAVPVGAETCGPVIHDRDESVFVAVQHPGEDGSWQEQDSFFPDYVPEGTQPRRGQWRGPRPSVIQVTRRR